MRAASAVKLSLWETLKFPPADELKAMLVQHGYRGTAADIIHIFCGGSNLHGAKGETAGDLDLCGIFIEPPPLALGIDRDEHFVSRTAAEGERNNAGDKDFTMYSLRKWAAMACKGNPNAPLFLFAPMDPYRCNTLWERLIVPNARLFIAKTTLVGNGGKGGLLNFARSIWKRAEAALQGREYHESSGGFLGFARSMLYRMQGKRGRGKKGQRPELELKFGYDTKAAMHMIRVMYEALELVRTGYLTFPNKYVSFLKEIRRGEWSKTDVESYFEMLEDQLTGEVRRSRLPDEIDRAAVSRLISHAYLEHWKEYGLTSQGYLV